MNTELNETIGDEIGSEESEEVISFVDNNVVLYEIDSIVSKSLITKRLRKSLQKSNKSLKTVIKFEIKENNYLISICGENKEKVIESKMILNRLALTVRRQQPFTHLVTVPFNSDPLRQEFCKFRDNVLSKEWKGIDESLFQNSCKLHLTLCVLHLFTQNDILSAKQVLKQCLDQIVKPIVEEQPLQVSVEGLDVLKGQPTRAHVVFAQIKDPSNRFQSICDQILGQFVKSGLLAESGEPVVKLHITFMNSLFRQRIQSKNKEMNTELKKRIKRESFDAKSIIDSYNSYKFCDSFVESIQLNDIKSKTQNGFYGRIESIDLPKK